MGVAVGPPGPLAIVLVCPPTTTTDVVRPVGCPKVEVWLTYRTLVAAVVGTVFAVVKGAMVVPLVLLGYTIEEFCVAEERIPLHNPLLQVLKAHCASEVQEACKFPQYGINIELTA